MRKLLVRLYPRAWRERYGDELLALLEDLPVAPATVLDLLHGAATAHWRGARAWASELRGPNRRRMLWSLIWSPVAVAVALAIFVPDMVSSTVALRRVHAAVVLLAVVLLAGNSVRTAARKLDRPRSTNVTALAATTAWISYLGAWGPGPTSASALETWVSRSVYILATIGCVCALVAEVVRAVRKPPPTAAGSQPPTETR